jgi:hypothetical protein
MGYLYEKKRIFELWKYWILDVAESVSFSDPLTLAAIAYRKF